MLTRIGSGRVVLLGNQNMALNHLFPILTLSLVMLNAQEIRGKITLHGFDFLKLYKSSVPIEIAMEIFLT